MLQADCHLFVFCMMKHDLMQAVAEGGEAAPAGAKVALCDEDCSQAFPEGGIADGPDRPQSGTRWSEFKYLPTPILLATRLIKKTKQACDCVVCNCLLI